MIKNWLKIVMFLSSYSVLFLILIVQHHTDKALVITLSATIVLSNAILLFALYRAKNRRSEFVKVKSIGNAGWENLAYIFSYVIPFLGMDYTQPADAISLLIFFLLVGFFYVRTSMIHINPMLNIFGYDVYKVTTKDDQEITLITRKPIKEAVSSKFSEIATNVMVG